MRRRLLVKIIGGVSLAILAIELILLVPSLASQRRRLRDIRMMTAKVLAHGVYQPVAESLVTDDRERALRIVEAAARSEYVSMVTLIDTNRTVLACSVALHVGQSYTTPAIEAALGQRGTSGASAEQGGKYLYALPIPGPQGLPVAALEVSVDLSDIPRALLVAALQTLGVVVIILVFTGAVIGLYLYAIVLKPVWRIVRANLAAAEGDRANAYVPAADIPDDEIGDIARTRNEMLAVIEQHSQDLEAVILRGISDPIALLDADRRVLLRNRPGRPVAGGAACDAGGRGAGGAAVTVGTAEAGAGRPGAGGPGPAAAGVDAAGVDAAGVGAVGIAAAGAGAPPEPGCHCEVHRLLPDLPRDACPVGRALETGLPASLAFAVEGAEGTRYLEAFTFPLAEDGAGGGGGSAAPGGPERTRKVIEQVRDVTERRRLEEAARRNERLAVVGELAAAMAHEIRNPLASIVASADLLDLEPGRPVDEEAQVLLGVLKKESKRVDRLLSDFLKFARPRPLRLARTDVNTLCRGIAELVRTHPKNNGRVTIREALDTALVPIETDADLLEQALLNIAINALEAMPQGGDLSIATAAVPASTASAVAGVTATGGVASEPVAPGPVEPAPADDGAAGGGVEITVADTGVGMSEAERQRIFEPFHTTKPDGTGLGLAITYRIVESHGGDIAVDSRPGGGTTVRIRLPRRPPPVPAPGRRSDRGSREAEGSGGRSGPPAPAEAGSRGGNRPGSPETGPGAAPPGTGRAETR